MRYLRLVAFPTALILVVGAVALARAWDRTSCSVACPIYSMLVMAISIGSLAFIFRMLLAGSQASPLRIGTSVLTALLLPALIVYASSKVLWTVTGRFPEFSPEFWRNNAGRIAFAQVTLFVSYAFAALALASRLGRMRQTQALRWLSYMVAGVCSIGLVLAALEDW